MCTWLLFIGFDWDAEYRQWCSRDRFWASLRSGGVGLLGRCSAAVMVLGPTRAGASRRSLQESGLGRSIPRSATWNRLVSSFPKNTKVNLGILIKIILILHFKGFFWLLTIWKGPWWWWLKKCMSRFCLFFLTPPPLLEKTLAGRKIILILIFLFTFFVLLNLVF